MPASRPDDPLDGIIRPPAGMPRRYVFYARRYGALQAALGYLGRYWPWFWSLVGPAVTSGTLRRWLEGTGPKILNLGGGSALFDRWLTADVSARADVYMDLTRRLPVPDGRVDVVYLEEVVEHLGVSEARGLLGECYRILRPGGHLRLTTPNLEYFARRVLTVASGEPEINSIFYDHGHRHIYAPASVERALRELGFVSLRQSAYREPESPFGHLDSHPARHPAPAEWSQYWDARKPSPNPPA